MKTPHSLPALREWYIAHERLVDGIACRRGCAFCCYIPVETTELEARAAYKASNQEVVNMRLKTLKGRDFEPCPFLDLKTKDCTVYGVRPTSCRQYTSTSRTKCESAHRRRDRMADIPADGVNYWHWWSLAAELEGPRKSLVEWIREMV